ncbi:hypothetical protein DXX93_11145 [Thalassotalea euphylliae]|uniref:Uncharacterized protein n=1 Tax=Thalassotalea euphylliae TaxID=1655234 RepID=A0A3E0TRC4_9GAMM|nr:hypothetical protein [Thalassotalea euphylliae]REL27064.1 hypothetical protein DXX93_11145 [Thalassotalea euphylliae]
MLSRNERNQFRLGIPGVMFLGYAPGFIKGVVEQDLAIPRRGGYEYWNHIYGFPAILISSACLILCFFALLAVYRKSRSLVGWEAKLGINLSFAMYLIGCALQFTGDAIFPLFICIGVSLVFIGVLMS